MRHHRCRRDRRSPILPPNKIDEGRLEDIRECIGCNMCVSRYESAARNALVYPERYERRGVPAGGIPTLTTRVNSDKTCWYSGPDRRGWNARVSSANAGSGESSVDEARDLGATALGVTLPGLGNGPA